MLIPTDLIESRYELGMRLLTNFSFNEYARNLYGLDYQKTRTDSKLLLLLHAVNSWVNIEGAVNAFTKTQMYGILDNIFKMQRDRMASEVLTDDSSECDSSGSYSGSGSGGSGTVSPSLGIMDTNSIDLTFGGNILSAVLRVSAQSGNAATINNDGIYVSSGAASSELTLTIKGTDFTGMSYNNNALAGKDLTVYHRGLGFLYYKTGDPDNEFELIPTGGFTLLIPGFDPTDGLNLFTISTTTYAN